MRAAKALSIISLFLLLAPALASSSNVSVAGVSFTTPVWEGTFQNFTLRFNVTGDEISCFVSANFTFNGTIYPTNRSCAYASPGTEALRGVNFSTFIPVGLVLHNATNLTFFWNYTLSYGNGTVAEINSSTFGQVVKRTYLTDCLNITTTPALNMSSIDEQNRTFYPNASVDITLFTKTPGSRLSRAYAFSFPENSSNHSVCIYPQTYAEGTGTFSLLANATISYASTGYSTRSYYLLNQNITTPATALSLFLLPTANSTELTVYTTDENGVTISGITLSFMRYWVGENAYYTVAMARTDSLGASRTTLLVPSTYYRIVATDGATTWTFDPVEILDTDGDGMTTLTLPLTGEQVVEYTSLYLGVSYGCSYSNTSVICVASKTSGDTITGTLTLLNVSRFFNQTICQNTVSGSSIAPACSLSNYSGASYAYSFIIHGTLANFTAVSAFIEFPAASVIPVNDQLILTALLSMGLVMGWVFVGPGAIPALAVLGLAASKFAGFINLDWGVIAGIAVAALIITLKAKG